MTEIVESRVDRDRLVGRVEALDKVKALRTLPDGVHVTTELVANYYEITVEGIRALVHDHRAELAANGYRVLSRAEFEGCFGQLPKSGRGGAQSIALFSRRAVLNVGMLLRDSPVARDVRAALLDAEDQNSDAASLDVTSLAGVEQLLLAAQRSLEIAKEQQQRAELAEAKVTELEPLAEGYRHFIEKDGTVKWANACEHLGVAPNLFGAYLRTRKVLYTDEYRVIRKGVEKKRQGERHNRPYSEYKHWFAFPAYDESEKLDHVPEHKQFDRRVTKAGMEGLRRYLKRHVVECGQCSMCQSVQRNKPRVFAEWKNLRQIGGAA